MDTTTSPARSPAACAGPATDLPVGHSGPVPRAASSTSVTLVATQADTAPMPGARSATFPMPNDATSTSRTAMMKWTVDPAARTTARWPAGWRQKARGSSAGSTSSSCVIPTIFTKPPAGMALTPYSVSPRWRDQIVGPKPQKNWVAFMP